MIAKAAKREMYYDRAMSPELVERITKGFLWLIDAVFQNSELDFQTAMKLQLIFQVKDTTYKSTALF